MRNSLRRVPAVAGIAMLLMSLAGNAQERWYEAYDDGIVAFGRMQWSVAEQKFRAALAIKPAHEQGQRVLFYGTRREPYLPEYYLAQVYLKLGRNKEAVDLLAKVERDGRITSRDPQFKELKSLVAGIPPPVAVVAGGLRNEVPPPPAATGPAAAGPPGGPLPGGGVPGGGEAGPGGGPPTKVSDGGVPAGSLAPGGGVPPDDGGLRGAAPASRGTLAGGAIVVPPITLPSPSAAIESAAMRAFFQGDYRQALELLDNAAFKQHPTPRRLFYVACSNGALGLLEGDKGLSRIATARKQFADAKGFDAQFVVDRRHISPRILDTLQSVER